MRERLAKVDVDLYEPDFAWRVYVDGYEIKDFKDPQNPDNLEWIPCLVTKGHQIGVPHDEWIDSALPEKRYETIYPLVAGRGDAPLFEVFSAINYNDDTAILEFAHRYGLLVSPHREDPAKALLTRLHDIRIEIQFMQWLLKLWDDVCDSKTEEVKKYFEWVTFDEEEQEYMLRYTSAFERSWVDGFLLSERYPIPAWLTREAVNIARDDWLTYGRLLVMSLVNERLLALPSVMQFRINNKLQPYTRVCPSSLAAAIWFQFFQYVAQEGGYGTQIVRCAYCGERGVVSGLWGKGRTGGKYEGTYYHKRCANALKQQRFREKHTPDAAGEKK